MGKIRQPKTLLIGDNELECNCDDLELKDLNVTHIGLNLATINMYELVIYDGKLGTKIIKSDYTKTGIIE